MDSEQLTINNRAWIGVVPGEAAGNRPIALIIKPEHGDLIYLSPRLAEKIAIKMYKLVHPEKGQDSSAPILVQNWPIKGGQGGDDGNCS